MSDIRLDVSTTDIDLTNGDMTLVTQTDAIAQHLLIRLRFFKGEYFLNLLLGIPYFQEILKKNVSLAVVRAIFREAILETPGVVELTRFDLELLATVRKLVLNFTCTVTGSDEPLDFSQEFLIG